MARGKLGATTPGGSLVQFESCPTTRGAPCKTPENGIGDAATRRQWAARNKGEGSLSDMMGRIRRGKDREGREEEELAAGDTCPTAGHDRRPRARYINSQWRHKGSEASTSFAGDLMGVISAVRRKRNMESGTAKEAEMTTFEVVRIGSRDRLTN